MRYINGQYCNFYVDLADNQTERKNGCTALVALTLPCG